MLVLPRCGPDGSGADPSGEVFSRKGDQTADPNEGDTARFVSMHVIDIVSPPLFRAFMECRNVLASERSRNGSEGWLSLSSGGRVDYADFGCS